MSENKLTAYQCRLAIDKLKENSIKKYCEENYCQYDNEIPYSKCTFTNVQAQIMEAISQLRYYTIIDGQLKGNVIKKLLDRGFFVYIYHSDIWCTDIEDVPKLKLRFYNTIIDWSGYNNEKYIEWFRIRQKIRKYQSYKWYQRFYHKKEISNFTQQYSKKIDYAISVHNFKEVLSEWYDHQRQYWKCFTKTQIEQNQITNDYDLNLIDYIIVGE